MCSVGAGALPPLSCLIFSPLGVLDKRFLYTVKQSAWPLLRKSANCFTPGVGNSGLDVHAGRRPMCPLTASLWTAKLSPPSPGP